MLGCLVNSVKNIPTFPMFKQTDDLPSCNELVEEIPQVNYLGRVIEENSAELPYW